MEGAAYALRHNLEFIEKTNDTFKVIRVSGGAAKSQLWNQIKADVLNREIEVIDGLAGAPLGVAILAGIAVGFYTNEKQVLKYSLQTSQKFTPSSSMHQFYTQKYHIYKTLYLQNKASFQRLSALFKEENK
jgi:xylulokinase